MSRVDLAKRVRRIAATAEVRPGDKSSLEVVAKLLEGAWTPPADRPEGYRCLGYDKLLDRWREVVWIGGSWYDLDGRGHARKCWPDALAPRPLIDGVARG